MNRILFQLSALIFGCLTANAEFDFTIPSQMTQTNSGSQVFIQGWTAYDVSFFPITEFNWSFTAAQAPGATATIKVPLSSVHPPGTYKLVVGFASQFYNEDVSAVIGNGSVGLVYSGNTWQTIGNFTSSISFSNIVITVRKVAPLGTIHNYWFAGAGIMSTSYDFIQSGINRWMDTAPITTTDFNNISPGNLIPNSSFELGFASGGWTSGRNGTAGNECWLSNMVTNDGFNGGHSAVIGDGMGASRFQIMSPPIWLRGDLNIRRYTLSFYYKRGPGGPPNANVGWSRPYSSSDNGNATINPTASWQRFQTNLNLAPSPNRLFQFEIDHVGNGPLLIDAVQFEESTTGARAYAPADPIEVGLSLGRNGNVLGLTDPRNVQVLLYNSTGFSSNVVFSYVCYDWMNRKVASGSANYTAPPGVSTSSLLLTTTNNGSQRIYGWLNDSPSFRSELQFSVLAMPSSSVTNSASILGTHGITGAGVVASNAAWGLSWQRGLSPGGIVQWNEIEPTQGNFTFGSTDAKVASCADKAVIFANLSDVGDIPAWAITNGVPRLDRLSNFVFQTVSHFKAQIHFWEDINEPSTAFSPSSFALMQAQIAGAVKTADPTAFFVGFGGLGDAVGINWGKSVWNLQSAATKAKIDAVSVHMYPNNPNLWMSADDDPKPDMAVSFGAFCGKPVWHTESGSYHWSGHGDKNGGLQGSPSYAAHNEEEVYRRTIWQTPELASRNWIRSLGAGASRFFYYDGRVAGYGYGREDTNPSWWDYDDALSPLGVAYFWSIYFLDTPSSIGQTANAVSDVRGFMFPHTNGAQVIATFSLSRSNYVGTVTDGRFAIFDLMGNLIQTNVTTVHVGRIPTYWVSRTLTASQLNNIFTSAAMALSGDTTPPAVSIDVSAHGPIPPSRQLPLRFRWTAVDDWEVNTDDTPLLVQTRFRFNGLTDWSPWSASRYTEMSTVPTSSTFLEVQARDADGNISSESGPVFGPNTLGLPVITSQPSSVVATIGSSVTFAVTATGALSYRWYVNGTAIPSATGTTLTVNNAQLSDAASYDVVVSNSAGSSTSAIAVLTLIPSGVLINGSFESGYSGWGYAGNQFITSRSSQGTNAVQFNPGQTSANGVLSQSFTTTPGQAYTVAFDVGADWGNAITPQSLLVTVLGNNTLLSQTVTVFGPGDGSSKYISTNFQFVADSANTTLAFRDVSPSGLNTDMLLDNVRISSTMGNRPPDSAINSPANSLSILPGQSVNFAGGGTDPDSNLPLTYLWNFGAGSGLPNSTSQNPGLLQFNNQGTFTVSLTVSDSLGLVDPTPATRIITVTANQPPDSAITAPLNSLTITPGQSVSFAGSGSDADNNLPLSYLWNFGAGSGLANSTSQNPGTRQFNNPGVFTVSLTVSDALGLADPTPATVVITVQTNQAVSSPLVNGSFESGYTGWTATGNQMISSRSSDGINAVQFNPSQTSPNGVLAQAFATAPGQPYTLSFDVGADWGTPSTPQSLQVTVTGASTLLSQTVTVFGPGDSSSKYTSTNFTFVPDSSTATLTFRDVSTTGISIDLLLDNVKIMATAINQSPSASITAPANDVTISPGQSVNFSGSGTDPDNNLPLTYLWTFGAGSGLPNSTSQNPGSLQFNNQGTFTVTFTVTDALGLADPTPVTRIINVQSAQAPNGTIGAPASDVTIAPGQSLSFAGSGVDLDNNLPLTYLWNFGAGSGLANSTSQNPGSVQFNNQGVFTVTFTVTDSLGIADPTPATRVITVQPNQPPPTILVNGSFESAYSGWTFSGNQTINLRASDGTNGVQFNPGQSSPNGVLSQGFATIPGQTYALAFDVGADWGLPTTPQSLQVTVTGGSTLLAQTVTVFGPGDGSSQYTSKNFTFVADSANTTLTFRDVSGSGLNMDLLLDNVRVTVSGGPTITAQPSNLTLSSGSTAVFTVAASGPQPLSYQWRFNGTSIPSATAAAYTIPNVQASNSGNYDVVVSNSGGSVTSTVASLTVLSSTILANGSFESGYASWTATGNQEINLRASDGVSSVQFNPGQTTPNGVLSQSFNTAPGQTYQLAFDIGADWGTPSTAQSLQVNVSGNGSLLSRSVTVFAPGDGSSRYIPTNFTFVANSTSTTLSFQDISPTGLNVDLLLDNVRVTAQSGTPAVLAGIVSAPVDTNIGMTSIELAPEGLRIRMAIAAKGQYELQSSQDFKTWSSLGSHKMTDVGMVEFLDPNASETKRFYRIVAH